MVVNRIVLCNTTTVGPTLTSPMGQCKDVDPLSGQAGLRLTTFLSFLREKEALEVSIV